MRMRPKVIGLAEESKVEDFETLEIFQVSKKTKAQEEEHNSHHITFRGEDMDH
jgi:outer membrane protease